MPDVDLYVVREVLKPQLIDLKEAKTGLFAEVQPLKIRPTLLEVARRALLPSRAGLHEKSPPGLPP